LNELGARRADYVAFVTSQVRDESLAEDIVQASLLKASERLDQLQADESANAWFYRMLRNAVTDHRRRESTASRGAARLQAEQSETTDAIERVPRPCRCVSRLMEGLKPEYAEALRRVEIDELTVKDFAREQSTSANNAGVRVFRARAALKQKVVATCGSCCTDGGCFDCTCPDIP
jgi:RNA polymerase sigma factor (sigma-70 family)